MFEQPYKFISGTGTLQRNCWVRIDISKYLFKAESVSCNNFKVFINNNEVPRRKLSTAEDTSCYKAFIHNVELLYRKEFCSKCFLCAYQPNWVTLAWLGCVTIGQAIVLHRSMGSGHNDPAPSPQKLNKAFWPSMKVNYIMQPTGTPNGTFTINRKDTFNVNNDALVFLTNTLSIRSLTFYIRGLTGF